MLELNIISPFHSVPQMPSHISASFAWSTDKLLIILESNESLSLKHLLISDAQNQ